MTSVGLGRNVLVLGLLLICGAPPSHQFLAQRSAPDAFEDVHTVHLRTGIVDVDAASRRLPESLTPAARRLLGHPSSAPPPAAPGWGPLAGAQLWLLTLGPETHLCPHHPSHHQHSQFLAHQQMRSSDGGSNTHSSFNTHTGSEGGGAGPHHHNHHPQSSATSAQQEQETAQGARFAERQAALQAALRNAGAAPVSFLPPAAWLVVVGRGADLGPLAEAFPDVRMAPYGPPAARVSPELAAAVSLLEQQLREAGMGVGSSGSSGSSSGADADGSSSGSGSGGGSSGLGERLDEVVSELWEQQLRRQQEREQAAAARRRRRALVTLNAEGGGGESEEGEAQETAQEEAQEEEAQEEDALAFPGALESMASAVSWLRSAASSSSATSSSSSSSQRPLAASGWQRPELQQHLHHLSDPSQPHEEEDEGARPLTADAGGGGGGGNGGDGSSARRGLLGTGAAGGGGGGGGSCGLPEPLTRRLTLAVHLPYLEREDLVTLSLAAAAAAAAAAVGQGTAAAGTAAAVGQAGASAGWDSAAAAAAAEALEDYNPAAAAAADWAAPLAALSRQAAAAAAAAAASPEEGEFGDCGCAPPVLAPDAGGPNILLVELCAAAAPAAVRWLAAAPPVSWLEPRLGVRLHNLIASAVVQAGGAGGAASSPELLASHPFWAAGIDGRNQTVGCGDSGLDVANCYFYDPAVPFMQNVKTDSNGMQYFLSSTHRKLRYYLAVVQDLSDSYGHGTHVSGTLVGSRFDRASALSPEPLDAATGQAPAARIAFMDLSRDKGDGVWTPGDLGRSYFNLTYRVGARVHSDSWGSDLTAYDSMAAALDRFTWNNPDFLSVFAAGNYGTASGATTTVTSPAVAKNCIAAGATPSMGTGDRPGAYGVTVYNLTATVNIGGGQGGARSVRVVGAAFGGDLAAAVSAAAAANGGVVALAAATPADACTGLSNAGGVRGRVLLVQRGRCYFSDKARAAAAAGATAVIVYNDKQDGYFLMEAPDASGGSGSGLVPMGSVPASTGRWLLAAAAAGNTAVSIRRAADVAPLAFDDVAAYSSFGPTTDGRIKPDITAPGHLLSANANPTLAPDGAVPSCGSGATRILSGTSMATPVIAGSALLARQYFADGWHSTEGRAAAPAAGISPSGALVKAVLLGGAVHMAGSVSGTGMPLEDVPSYRQGFGRISLLHSLPLPSATGTPGWRLQFVDGAALAQGESHRFCVRATGGPLRVTLAWYDWPGDPAAARSLVNNLDLQVRAAGRAGTVELGNGVQDAVNTVEQVWYGDLAAGDVAITVAAPTVFARAGRQPYALVVQGRFSGTLRPPAANSSASASTCAVQLAVVDEVLSADTITNRKDSLGRVVASFYFTAQDGTTPAGGFQCKLTLEAAVPGLNASSYAGVVDADWVACSSPRGYVGLLDGRYSFQVRVRGEEVAAVRSLTVDATPPVTTLTSTLPPPPSPGAVVTTPSDNATFTFVATDVSSSISFTCNIGFSNGPAGQDQPPRLRRAPTPSELLAAAAAAANSSSAVVVGGSVAVAAGVWFACESPMQLMGLTFGDYELQVLAYDAVRNPETTPKSVSWRIRYAPNTAYARVASGPAGLVASRDLSFGLAAFMGASSPDLPPAPLAISWPPPPGAVGFESAAVPLPAGGVAAATPAVVVAVAGGNWTAVGGSTLQVSLPADGSYLVVARPAGSTDNTTWGLAAVQVDTTPPVVRITRKPEPKCANASVPATCAREVVQSDPRVTITFGDDGPDRDGDVRAYACRWLGPAPAPPSPDTPDDPALPYGKPYGACSGSSTYDNMTEGYWLFQVKGRDAAGNVGAPASAAFRTDLRPPAISAAAVPAATNATRLSWSYTVDDGPEGTGVANVSCSMRWSYLVAIGNVTPGTSDYPAGSPAARWVTPCPNPARYTVQEGSYLWSLAATDGAGLRASADFAITVDRTPPVSRVFALAGRPMPARVTLEFASADKPDGSPSGVAQQRCRLDAAAAPPPASPPPAPPLPPSPAPPPPAASPPPSSSSPGSGSGSGSGSSGISGASASASRRRQLRQASPAPSPPPSPPPAPLPSPPPPSSGGGGGGGGSGPRIYNGSAITLGEWHVCDAVGTGSNVTYDGLSTGYYTFSLRAVDAAGNVGDPTPPLFFAVDASLPPDGAQQVQTGGDGGSSNKTTQIVIGVLVLVGVLLAIAAIVAVVVLRRRALRKRQYAGAAAPYANGNGHAANGNGNGYATNGNGYTANGNGNGGAAVARDAGGIAMQPLSTHASEAAPGYPVMPGYPPPPPVAPPAAAVGGGGISGGGASANPFATAPSMRGGGSHVSVMQSPGGGGGGGAPPALGYPAASVSGRHLAAAPPPPPDPALAAALAASAAAAAEAERTRSSAAAAEAAEAERLRRAIAASLEEENLRRAMAASLAASQTEAAKRSVVDADQAALDAAIAASLASSEAEQRRQAERLRQQMAAQGGQGQGQGGAAAGSSARPPLPDLL